MKKILVTLLGLAIVSSIGTTALATTNKSTISNEQNSISESLLSTAKTFTWHESGRWQDGMAMYNPETRSMWVTSKSNNVDLYFSVDDRSYFVGYAYQEAGEKVRGVQVLLNSWLSKYNKKAIAVDGYYGPATSNAAKEFQRSHRLTADGIIGTKTWIELYYAL